MSEATPPAHPWGKPIPTALSLCRILAAPIVAPLILSGERNVSFAWLAVAGATDFFDGYLARRFAWQSRTGAWADAVSDKVLLSTVFICLAMAGDAPTWLVALIFGRDLLILLMAAFALLFTPFRDFPPSVWGKLSTNVQILAAAVLVLGFRTLHLPVIYLCAATTLWSGLHYLFTGLTRLRNLQRRPN